jgi:hypothetical protein
MPNLPTLTVGSLLRRREVVLTRERRTLDGADEGTGAPVFTTTTARVRAHFRWLTNVEAQDFKSDATALAITTAGLLQAGDVLTHANLGRFLVLEEGPKRVDAYDRVPLRRA